MNNPCTISGEGLSCFCSESMKTIPLTRGKVALVDDEDHEWLSYWKWQAMPVFRSNILFKAARTSYPPPRKTISMAREIMNAKSNDLIDHKNRNPLDNRKSNLRLATHSQNAWNRGASNPKSSFKGVYPTGNRRNPWQSFAVKNKTKHYFGVFPTAIEAAKEYDRRIIRLFGEYAVLNFPPSIHE